MSPVVILNGLWVTVDVVTSGEVWVVARVRLEAAHASVRHCVNGLGKIGGALEDDLLRKLLWISGVSGDKFTESGKSVVDVGVREGWKKTIFYQWIPIQE